MQIILLLFHLSPSFLGGVFLPLKSSFKFFFSAQLGIIA